MHKPSLTAFRYRENPEREFFPVIPVRAIYERRGKDIFALIDSGVTISIFRTEVAEDLNITIESGEEIIMGGVGGRIKGYLHTIAMIASRKRFSCPVIFSYDYRVSFNLLGRRGFFEQFRITFDERKRIVDLH